MFPAPTTIAICTPLAWTLDDLAPRSPRRAPGRCRSSGRPSAPPRELQEDAPERPARPAPAAAPRRRSTRHSGERVAARTRAPRRRPPPAPGRPSSPVVDPRLVAEHAARRRTRLLSMPSTIFVAGLLGLRRRPRRRLLVDLALGRDLVLAGPRRGAATAARERDVHRELAREVGVAARLHQHADLVRRRVHVGGERSPSPASNRAAPTTTMFSPSLAIELLPLLVERVDRVGRLRRRRPRAPSRRTPGTRRSSRPARSRSRRRRACRVPSPEPVEPTRPSVVSRPARLPPAPCPSRAAARRAASMSPPVSTSARLQSIIPAPVWSRSSLTRLAEISVTGPPPSLARALAGCSARRLLGGPGSRPTATGPPRLGASAAPDGLASACGRRRPRARPLRRRGLPRPPARLGRGLCRRPRPRRGAASAPAAAAVPARGELLRGAPSRPASIPSAIARTIRLARADRVVVARDHVVGLVGVAVRVDERDDRQVRAGAPRAPRAAPCAGRR